MVGLVFMVFCPVGIATPACAVSRSDQGRGLEAVEDRLNDIARILDHEAGCGADSVGGINAKINSRVRQIRSVPRISRNAVEDSEGFHFDRRSVAGGIASDAHTIGYYAPCVKRIMRSFSLDFCNQLRTMRLMSEINFIRKKRETLKMTRQEFAQRIGVSVRTVQGWEVGRNPSKTALRLAEVIK